MDINLYWKTRENIENKGLFLQFEYKFGQYHCNIFNNNSIILRFKGKDDQNLLEKVNKFPYKYVIKFIGMIKSLFVTLKYWGIKCKMILQNLKLISY